MYIKGLRRYHQVYFFLFFALLLSANTFVSAQNKDIGPSILIGTQFPLQYTAGFNYHFSPTISARAQVGLLTKPYDRIVLETMEWFGLKESMSNLIEQSLDHGSIFTLGGNYHFGKSYVGIYGQYAQLKGEASLEQVAGAYLGRDLSFLSPFGLSIVEIVARSNLHNVEVVFGRSFVLPNPRYEIMAEASIAKIIGSDSYFSTNQRLLEQLPLVKQLYQSLQGDFRNAYRKYGYLPSINIYINYHF